MYLSRRQCWSRRGRLREPLRIRNKQFLADHQHISTRESISDNDVRCRYVVLIGNIVDGVVLTVRGGRTPREHVLRTRDKLLRSKVEILGVLINNLEEESIGYGRYYSYYGKAYSASEKPYAETPRVVAR